MQSAVCVEMATNWIAMEGGEDNLPQLAGNELKPGIRVVASNGLFENEEPILN